MDLTRRTALTYVGTLALGAGGAVGAQALKARLDADTPLPIYGSPASGIRPDRAAPAARSTSIVWGGAPDVRRVALTFDDGPSPDWTPQVLAALARADAPATFFCVGRQVRDHGELHRSSVGRHELANHTFSHHDLGRLDLDQCRAEIRRTNELMERTYGSAPTLFRPPYGHLGGATVLAAAEAGMTTVLWSAQAREDVVSTHPDAVADDIARQVRPGSIVLGHDAGSTDRLTTISRLGRIIERLRADGYELVTVSELLTPSYRPVTS